MASVFQSTYKDWQKESETKSNGMLYTSNTFNSREIHTLKITECKTIFYATRTLKNQLWLSYIHSNQKRQRREHSNRRKQLLKYMHQTMTQQTSQNKCYWKYKGNCTRKFQYSIVTSRLLDKKHQHRNISFGQNL